jgi:hypothetical protein
MRVRGLLLLVFAVAIGVAPASAQIFSWRDANGVLVVSDKPSGDPATMTTYTVPGAPYVRATREFLPTSNTHYDAYIEEHARIAGLSPDLVRAVIQVESAFNPKAVSPKGAMGLMQLMPATARELGVTDPFHPGENIRGGVQYLKQLMDRYDQKVELALAAYNAGPESVARYGDVPPYRETQAYVKKVTRTSGSMVPPPTIIYKWVEAKGDGGSRTRYSNRPPAGVPYEIVGRQ